MANEILVFDAVASGINGESPGSPLIVGPGTPYGMVGGEYPAAPQDVLYTSSIDTEGALAAGASIGNRTITLKFKFVDPTGTLLAGLQAKYAKVRREGATFKRTMKDGSIRIYDLLSAGDGWSPAYGFEYYVAHVTEVEMSLPARPYSRGAEVDLGDNVETTASWLIFTEASLAGDAPGLGRLVVDNDEATAQRSFVWGLRSRYYDSAATAAVFYQAELCALVGGSGSVTTTRTGATGSGNTVVAHTGLLGTALPLMYIGTSSTAQTHRGEYRVIVRAQSPAANAGIVSLQATWAPNGSAATAVDAVTNDWVAMADLASDVWEVLDLGSVSLPTTPRGTQGWIGAVQAASTVGGDDVYIDWVALLPVTEGWGVLKTSDAGQVVATTGGVEIAHDGARLTLGGYLGKPRSYEGDYMLIPPSGAEARTLEVIAKFLRYRLDEPATTTFSDVPDNISARLFYTPRYLT